jgi:hypothetical protein
MVYPSERFLYDCDFVVSSGYYISILEATTLSPYFFQAIRAESKPKTAGAAPASATKSSRILGFRGNTKQDFSHALWSKPGRRIVILEFLDITESI